MLIVTEIPVLCPRCGCDKVPIVRTQKPRRRRKCSSCGLTFLSEIRQRLSVKCKSCGHIQILDDFVRLPAGTS